MPDVIAPGALIEVRDALWRVLKVDQASTGRAVWTVTGVSPYVQDEEAVFLEDYEPSVRVLAPEKTTLVADESPQHRAGLLYLESLLQDLPPPDDALVIGHKGAFDPLPFQLDPARQALSALRARILIADAVGLGKTLEAGVLLAELIRRGKAKRILVVAVKSMLTQFQKELWTRFSIPLVRLDSEGLKRIRERVPTNHNPFHHYDRVIVSVDTLKQNNAFRSHLEASRWDVIVIDEAHNVAERGTNSQRSRLAKLLSSRSSALVMLSATPHDGRATSFASLMNMLDPTAIANPEKYTPDEIRGLFIRRFKKDIKDQISSSFPERVIEKLPVAASQPEEAAYAVLADLKLKKLGRQGAGGGGMLFKTLLEKSLFSSPQACLQTIHARTKKLEVDAVAGDADAAHDIAALGQLEAAVAAITTTDFSRYQFLVKQLVDKKKGMKWSRKADDRLVIFTERVETLKFLAAQLPAALGLKDGELEILHGTLGDVEQQRVVEEFGQEQKKVRVLVASDVASEGINLHFQAHRLVHFDVPWSLMVFQQRNGRIDRYGQEQQPEIHYLLTGSSPSQGPRRCPHPGAARRQGRTGEPRTSATPPRSWASTTRRPRRPRPRARWRKARPPRPSSRAGPRTPPSTRSSFCSRAPRPRQRRRARRTARDALGLRQRRDVPGPGARRAPGPAGRPGRARPPPHRGQALPRVHDAGRPGPSLPAAAGRGSPRRRPGPAHRRPRGDAAGHQEGPQQRVGVARSAVPVGAAPCRDLGPRPDARAVRPARGPGHRGDAAGQGRERAGGVRAGAQPAWPAGGHRWYGAVFRGTTFDRLEAFEAVLARTRLGTEPLPNPKRAVGDLQALVPVAVAKVRARVLADRADEEQKRSARLEDMRAELTKLRNRKDAQIELDFTGPRGQGKERDGARRAVARTFAEFETWVQETLATEAHPFLQVVAVLRGAAK
jgi:superfamily II DNA or RNA helicase